MSGGSSSRPLPTPKPPTRKGSDPYDSSPEKENQSPKPHRPLPEPKAPRALLDAPVSVDSFYSASSSKPRAGSSHTTYLPPSPPLPAERSKDTAFREPELIDEDVPPLDAIGSDWGRGSTPGPWDLNFRWNSNKVDIDGRSDDEELKWSDPDVLKKAQRPGPGILPTLLSEILHSPDHTLYSVRPTAPPPKTVTSSTSPPPPAPVPSPPPTSEELNRAVPHPNAYYCKEHNGWVLLSWCSSSVLPPLSPTFKPDPPLPDQFRRKRTSSCTGEDEHSVGRANVTHHFHRYVKAVDASMLTTPFKRSEWEAQALRKQQRRKMTVHLDEERPDPSPSPKTESAEPDLLDLYICCQCSVYCLVSQVIPGVLPIRVLEEFVKDKLEHPPPGKTGELTLVTGLETIITYVLAPLFVTCMS